MNTWKTQKLKNLSQILLKIKTEHDMLNFLRDLCTLEELEVLSGRLQAAIMIKNNVPYREIAKKTGLSTATITRIAHWLKHGTGGYEKMLKK